MICTAAYAYTLLYLSLFCLMLVASLMSLQSDSMNFMEIHYPFDVTLSPMRELTFVVSTIAQCYIEIFNLCFQCCYFNLCLHVNSTYSNLSTEIILLNSSTDTKDLKRKLKNALEYYTKIKALSFDIFNSFKFIIVLSIFCDIITLGIALTMYDDFESLVKYLSFTPFIFYDIWIYCYGTTLMTSGVSYLKLSFYYKN